MRLQRYTETVASGASLRLPIVGTFLRIVSASGAFDLTTDDVQIKAAAAGDGFQKKEFSFLTFKDTSGASNTISWVCGDAEFLNAPGGVVTVTENAPARIAAASHTANTVGVASAQVLAANPARDYLYVENQSASAVVSLRFGAAATGPTGITLGPGQWKEWDCAVPTQALHAISTIAATAMLTVEGV